MRCLYLFLVLFFYNRDEFEGMRDECFRISRKDRQVYVDKVDASSLKNPKCFWNHVKDLAKSNSIPKKMFLNNSEASNSRDICKT